VLGEIVIRIEDKLGGRCALKLRSNIDEHGLDPRQLTGSVRAALPACGASRPQNPTRSFAMFAALLLDASRLEGEHDVVVVTRLGRRNQSVAHESHGIVSDNPPSSTDRDPSPVSFWFLFAPGAGAPSSSPWMREWEERISHIAPVITFDYHYQLRGSARPDPQVALIERHLAILREGKDRHGPRAILIGKSMGSRIGCHVAALEPCLGVVCLGYPLRGQNGKSRAEALFQVPSPVLCVQGTRDSMCPLHELEMVFQARRTRSEKFIVETGDHSLIPTRRFLKESGLTDGQVQGSITRAVRDFAESLG
jgi:uncharacterized protein